MDLKRLSYFAAVADHLSFTKAAQALNMAQPPLSQQVKALEGELGFQLFQRSKRKSPTLTPEGRAFLAETRKLLEAAGQLDKFVIGQRKGQSGEINVAYMSSLQTEKFATLLRQFNRKNGEIKVNLSTLSTLKQMDAFRLGSIDIGFARKQKRYPAGYKGKTIGKHQMKLAVPLGHALASKKKAEWKDLAGEKLILLHPATVNADYYSVLLDACDRAGFAPSLGQTTVTISDQVWLVSAGQGIAPIAISENFRNPGVVLLELPKEAPQYEVDVIWRAEPSSTVIDRFLQHAIDAWD